MAKRGTQEDVLMWLVAHPREPFKFIVLGTDRLVGGYRCGDEIHLYTARLERESVHRPDGTLVWEHGERG